ncbi:MAG TPA: threonine-phosphate decarboxylase CobD [Nitrospiraceae bacterium]|jgi:threonine-phosphate decarboxylase|nr:threonine-phosphate decarboxylase CobD [Nitrospiraceae bacterium]HXC68299.1 threonine-phosphate decarboxylase CobD [Nitrospiraceae bacterium]
MNQPTHGGNVYKAAQEQRVPVEQIIDFSASINPLGPPAAVLRAIRSALKQIVHYPDPDCRQLRHELAQRCGLDPDMILVGNGSSELIHLLPRALRIRSALIIGPTFEEYARALLQAGSVVQYIHAQREQRFRPPLQAVLERLSAKRSKFDAVFLCNPNNPTGQVMNRRALGMLAEVVERQQGWLIVDEAFIDYCHEQSVVSLLNEHPRMVVLRSLTKFYAMPGLRIGYLLGTSKVLGLVKERQPPWSVNSLAQEASCAGLQDEVYAKKSRVFMENERSCFVRGLRSLSGLQVYSSAANFILIGLPAWTSAGEVTDRLDFERLLVRDCSTLPGLTAQMIRVAIRTAKENQRLLTALSACLKTRQA